LAFVTASAVAWSLAGFFTRLVPLDSWTLLAWRGLFGGLGMVAVIAATARGRALQDFRDLGWQGWFFAVLSAIAMILYITALRHTTVAHVSVIYATVPFVAAGLGWLVARERPRPSAVAASLASLAGVVLMVGVSRDGRLMGDLLALGMTACMAAVMVIARRYPGIPIMPVACLSCLLSSLACWPLGRPLAVPPHDLVLLALFGLLNSTVGLAFFTLGARHLPAIETALIGSLEAPLAPLWVWLAFGETPGASTLVGGLVVFFAVAVHIAAAARSQGLSKRRSDLAALAESDGPGAERQGRRCEHRTLQAMAIGPLPDQDGTVAAQPSRHGLAPLASDRH
jgi:drug/metabolite transporter (DMT)-like permease